MNKKGQMKLSFGMIFSILLMIIFIIFAFYGIQKFLAFQKELKYQSFTADLQGDIDKMWKSSQGSNEVSYILPTDVSAVCFIPDEYENLIYRSKKPRSGEMIEHLNILQTIGDSGSLCINNIGGKVEFIIQKNYGDSLVTISVI